ncbi:hypothetical protein B0H14DRAFT_2932320, partial [Mycena olivaceomarginata]
VLATDAPVLWDFSCLLTPLLGVCAALDPTGQGFSLCGCGCSRCACWCGIFPVRIRLLVVHLWCTQRTIQPAMVVGGNFLCAAAASARVQCGMQRPSVGDYAGRYQLGYHGEGAATAVVRVCAALNGGGSGCSR